MENKLVIPIYLSKKSVVLFWPVFAAATDAKPENVSGHCKKSDIKLHILIELKPIVIETNRLILNGFSPQDLTFIFENYSKDKIKKILGHRTDKEFEKEKFKQTNGYSTYNRSFILFLMTEKKSNTIIGRCGLHNWNKEHTRAEIGYNIVDENFKRNGFMTETVNAVIEYGFKELKLHRIEALVGSYNIPSIKILEKQNFVREGLLREHYFISDKYVDSILFSKLSSEYLEKDTDKTTTR